jgi:ABC-2 type transport system permease protein
MGSLWLVARHEYQRTVFNRRFVAMTLAVPAGILLLVALSVLVFTSMGSDKPIGYVDHSGLLSLERYGSLPGNGDRVQLLSYETAQAALVDLEAGGLQAVFVFPQSYPESLQTELYYLDTPPDGDAWGDLDDFVRINLVKDFPTEVQERLLVGADITIHDLSSGREFNERNIAGFIVPYALGFFFFFATMMASGQMLGVVAGEKENRTIEILITSVTPGQLIGGKAAGLLASAVTQLVVYVLALLLGIKIAAPYIVELQRASIPWDYLIVMGMYFLPTFGLMSALMIAVGSAVTDMQQGQQIAGPLNLVFMLPLFVVPLLIQGADSFLVTFLTLFPTTSFMTIALRWSLGSVPLWQLAVGWGLLVATMLFMIWAAGRIFHAGMLRYGQSLDLKAAMAVVRRK